MKEQDIQREILHYLERRGVFCWKNHSTGIYDPKIRRFRRNTSLNGVSDILGILPCGTFLAIEVKTETGKPNKNQKDFIKNICENQGIAFIARSVEDVRNQLIDHLHN